MLTLDVKGAFDAVLPGRLVRRLREHGWSYNIIRWVGSFATDRMVQIYLDDEMGSPRNITFGLPQSSPVSPILLMLFIFPVPKLGNSLKKICHANNVATLATKNCLSESCQDLFNSLAVAIEWGKAEGITFYPNKSELQQFSRHRWNEDPLSTPSVTLQSLSVSENTSLCYTRWLGIFWGKTLCLNSIHAFAERRPWRLQIFFEVLWVYQRAPLQYLSDK